VLGKGRKKCADKGDFVRNNLNFVKDVPLIYVNFITIASIAAEKI
jgi:hypothetical protein